MFHIPVAGDTTLMVEQTCSEVSETNQACKGNFLDVQLLQIEILAVIEITALLYTMCSYNQTI